MTDARFQGIARLRRPPEFKRVFAKGQRQHDAYFTVVVLNNDLNRARLGITVSKRNARFAVQRNRIKRLVRENFRLSKSLFPALDIVVMAKPTAKDVSNDVLVESLSKHWRRFC